MTNRDDFSQEVKRILAMRAAQICSNPDCRAPTSGPHTQPNKAINLGIAAHICAAAPGGKRYNKDMTQIERAGIENAIWLCPKCAKLVDSDEQKYTVSILKEWREQHERRLAEGSKGVLKEIQGIAASLRIGRQDITRHISEEYERILQQIPGTNLRNQPTLEPIRRIVPDNPPPLPAVFTPRKALVHSINERLKGLAWLALIASTSMGKTQIARNIYEQWPNTNKHWISLRGRKEQLQYHVNEQLLCFYVAMTGDETLRDKYDTGKINARALDQIVAEVAGKDSFIVIDDLPDLLGEEILIECLKEVGTAFQNVGGKLLTTSQRQLPQEILNTVRTGVLHFTVPPMNKEDIKLMLGSAGAPTQLQRDNISNFLLGVTKGHPSLIAATVRWLSTNGWNVDGLNFDALLVGEPMQEARQETSRLTRRLIGEIQTRELLDRLSIVNYPFNAAMALAIANTEPKIVRQKERFDELVGPWIQPLAKSQFEVSPLLQNLWQSYLNPELQKRLHYDIAHEYLKKRTINANDAFQVCIHLHTAEDWKTLVSFLIQFILQINAPEHAKHFDWVQWFFSPGKEWPDAIPIGMRIFARALQVRVLIMSGQEYERYDADLEQLISTAGDEDTMAVAAARFHTGVILEQASPSLTARKAMEAARAWHSIERKIPLETPPVAPEMLFWGATVKLNDRKQIRPIITVIKGMSEGERKVVFSSDIGPEMTVMFADSCYGVESAKDKSSQNWEEILAILDELQEIGKLPGAEFLYSAMARARAIVLADFMDNTDEALKALSEFPPGLSKDSSFVLISTKASILLTKMRSAEAFDDFKEALSIQEGKKYRLLYYETLKRGMLAASQTGHYEHAKAWCKKAIQILHGEETRKVVAGEDYQYDYLEMLGELAWILWNSGYPMKSCAAMHAIVHQLVKADDIENPRYKETFLKTGHVLGWLGGVAYKGEPPSITVGGEEYMTPYPGIFCYRAPRMAELSYIPGKSSFLLSQIAMMASGVGQLKLARKAYLLASETATQEGLLVYATIMELELSSLNSYIGDYGAAFASLLAGIIGIPLIKRGSLEAKDNPMEVWGSLPVEEKIAIEDFHIYHLVILPAFAGLLKYRNNKELCLQMVNKIQEAMGSVQENLLTYDRSVSIINNMRLAFDAKDQQQNISDILRTLKPDDHYERLILYIALASQPNARPEVIANTQAIALPYVNETGAYGDFTRKSISEWIVKSWYEELENRSFRLNTPRNLRNVLEGMPRTSDLVSDAARVLLAAEYSAGTTYNKDVRENLIEMTKGGYDLPP